MYPRRGPTPYRATFSSDGMSDDDGHQANRIAALRLALAMVTDSPEALRLIVEEIDDWRGCWACICREILRVLADLTRRHGHSLHRGAVGRGARPGSVAMTRLLSGSRTLAESPV
jgi:hypothetical protein